MHWATVKRFILGHLTLCTQVDKYTKKYTSTHKKKLTHCWRCVSSTKERGQEIDLQRHLLPPFCYLSLSIFHHSVVQAVQGCCVHDMKRYNLSALQSIQKNLKKSLRHFWMEGFCSRNFSRRSGW